jgi:hypothetical protein
VANAGIGLSAEEMKPTIFRYVGGGWWRLEQEAISGPCRFAPMSGVPDRSAASGKQPFGASVRDACGVPISELAERSGLATNRLQACLSPTLS